MTTMAAKFNRRVLIVVVIAVVAIIALLAIRKDDQRYVAPPSNDSNSISGVNITEDGFVPETIKVSSGGTVMWTNVDGDPHRVAGNPYPADDKTDINSKSNMATGGIYEYTFDKPGTYKYHDEVHPEFNGTVIVE